MLRIDPQTFFKALYGFRVLSLQFLTLAQMEMNSRAHWLLLFLLDIDCFFNGILRHLEFFFLKHDFTQEVECLVILQINFQHFIQIPDCIFKLSLLLVKYLCHFDLQVFVLRHFLLCFHKLFRTLIDVFLASDERPAEAEFQVADLLPRLVRLLNCILLYSLQVLLKVILENLRCFVVISFHVKCFAF